jgi:hypothetical protein
VLFRSAGQNPNSLTYKEYVEERKKQQQLLNLKTPRAALDTDGSDAEIDDLLRQLQGMTKKADTLLPDTLPDPRALLYCSEFIKPRTLKPSFKLIYQSQNFRVYRYHLGGSLTFSLNLDQDLHGNPMSPLSEAKIYRETRHPEL